MTKVPPRVSILLASFNHEAFIAEAVESCLAQDYPNLQIFISDDASEDASFDIARELVDVYDGPHDVVLNRNEKNLFLDHIPGVFGRLDGELIILACSDDVHYPNRASTLVDLWRSSGASVLSSAARRIDAAGRAVGVHRQYDAAPDLSLQHFLQNGDNATCFGAGLAWDRRVFDMFGFLGPGARNIDFNIPARGLLLGGTAFHNAPLLDWRQHDENTTLRVSALDATSEDDALFTNERFYLNRLVNWHEFIRDAQTAGKHGLDAAVVNQVISGGMTWIHQLIGAWRPVRHEITRRKIDRF